VKQRRELQRLLRSLHEIGTHRQLVSVFSSPPDDDSSVETKATRFCDDLLHAILRSYRIDAASHGGGAWEVDPEDMPEKEASTHHAGGSGHRGKRRGSAYVPFSKTAAGLDASIAKEKNREVRSALLRSNSGLSWGGSDSSPAPSNAGSQSRLPADAMAAALDRVSQAALAATRLKEGGRVAQERSRSQSRRSGSLKRQGQAGRSRGNQWSTATHSAEDSTASSQSGLLSQVVSWGRTDIVRQVLIEPQLTTERTERKMRGALQEGWGQG